MVFLLATLLLEMLLKIIPCVFLKKGKFCKSYELMIIKKSFQEIL